VGVAARRSAEAGRARAEAEALSSLAGAELAEERTLTDVLERVRLVFGVRETALLERDGVGWSAVETSRSVADAEPDEVERRLPIGDDLALAVRGPELFAADVRVLESFAEAAASALQRRRLSRRAAEAARLEAADRVRTALLAAVGHDLRTPLAAVKAAVSSLRQTDVEWSAAESHELLTTVEQGADRLQRLVENLLDASRLDAGAVTVTLEPVGVDEIVGRALLSLADARRVDADVPDGLPDVLVDVGLAERILANLVENALRHDPGRITVRAGPAPDGTVTCEVVDHGPGIRPEDRAAAFEAFRRLGSPDGAADRSASPGLGLGLAVARGFAQAVHATLVADETAGGGLTMRLTLPTAAPDPQPGGTL
jgi:two-component system, OmpR family, sensor histidine kinase KdpD